MKEKAKKMKNEKPNKIPRGYRLKPATHQLIVKIQKLLGSDQDQAIAAACTSLYAELQKNGSAK